MKAKKCNGRLVLYEIKNIIGNPFIPFFGIVFPVLMLAIITKALASEVPASMLAKTNTGVFISMSLIIPMAVILLGYASTYSQELEKDIPVRMRLFGFREGTMMIAKAIAQTVCLTVGIIIYVGVAYLILDLETPKPASAFCLIFCLYLSGVLFFLFAHGLASIFKKFGITYAIAMLFYFGSMMLCGMMGIRTDQLPTVLRQVAALLPMSYISSDFVDFWQGGSYNFVPIIQAFLFFGAACGILILYANYRNRRVLK